LNTIPDRSNGTYSDGKFVKMGKHKVKFTQTESYVKVFEFEADSPDESIQENDEH
jgi:hypothetical protein